MMEGFRSSRRPALKRFIADYYVRDGEGALLAPRSLFFSLVGAIWRLRALTKRLTT